MSALRPNAASGRDHARHPSVSINRWQIAIVCAARPALKSANELVHRFLLIGNTRLHANPASMAANPASHSVSVRRCAPGSFSHVPAKTPASAVAIAGTVLSTPSGS